MTLADQVEAELKRLYDNPSRSEIIGIALGVALDALGGSHA